MSDRERVQSSNDLTSWLENRGRNDEAEDLVTFVDVIYFLTRSKESRLTILAIWGRAAWKNRNLLRSFRTNTRRIGSTHADRTWILGQRMIWQPVRARIIGFAITAAISLAIGLTAFSATLVAIAVASSRSRGGKTMPTRSVTGFPIIIGAPAFLYSIYINLDQLWLIWFSASIGWAFYQSSGMFDLLRMKLQGNPFGFIPLSSKLWLLIKGRWSAFAIGIDKAVSDDPARAEIFIQTAEPQLPKRLTPVMHVARAVANARVGHIDEALQHLAKARDCELISSTRIAGWVALQSAEVLQICVRDTESLLAVDRAIKLLHPYLDRYWIGQAKSMRIRLRLQQNAPAHELLPQIHAMRYQALRRLSEPRVVQTEVWLLWLMLRSGNELGALKLATRAARWSSGLGEYGLSIDQLAKRHLLLSEILQWNWETEEARDYAARVRNEESVFSEERPRSFLYSNNVFTDDLTKSSDQLALDLAFRALYVLRGTHQPLTESSARLIIARCLAHDDPADSLAQTLTAIRAIQRVRYQLPASAWRGSWELLHAHAYARAIGLSHASGDTELTVELVEGMKSQAVPLLRGGRNDERVAILDTLLLSPFFVPDAASTALTGADPLRFVPAITVEGACWSAAVSDEPIALEAMLDAIAPNAWYWSGIVIFKRYYWVVRDPSGKWHTGCSDDANLPSIIAKVWNSLPIRLNGESDNAYLRRMNLSPLYRDRRRDVEDHTEFDLLSDTAGLLLPDVLRSALTAAEDDKPLSLLVGLGADLMAIPITGWPLSGDVQGPRIIERACVTHVPSIALLSVHGTPPIEKSRYPLGLAILGPDQDAETGERRRLGSATVPPPNARRSSIGSLSKPELRDLLQELADDPLEEGGGRTLLIAGHVEPSMTHEPAKGGLELEGEARLCLRDLVTMIDGHPEFPMPERVILACCGSIGAERVSSANLESSSDPGDAAAHAVEWLGFAAGIIVAGAEDVICTLYPIPDILMTMQMDHELAVALVAPENPAAALRKVQISRLRAWRNGESMIPLLWQSYAHVAATRTPAEPGESQKPGNFLGISSPAILSKEVSELYSKSVSLKNIGKRREAIYLIEKAIDILEQLVETDRMKFLDRLALWIEFRYAILVELDRDSEALDASQILLRLWEELAEADRDSHFPRVAGATCDLSVCLAKVGRHAEALVTAEKAVAMHESLVESNREAHLEGLAQSFHSLRNRLSKLDRQNDALSAAERTVELWEELVSRDRGAHLPVLARCQNTLVSLLDESGQPQEAIAAARRAVELRQELVDFDRHLHLPDLAIAVNRLAVVLGKTGLNDQAVAATRHAVELQEGLVSESRAAHLPDLASSMNNLAFYLGKTGVGNEAIAAASYSIELYEELVMDDRAAHLPDLANALSTAVEVRHELGVDTVSALELCERSIQYYRELASIAPIPFESRLSEVLQLRAELTL